MCGSVARRELKLHDCLFNLRLGSITLIAIRLGGDSATGILASMLLLTSICSTYYSAAQNHSLIYTYAHVLFLIIKKTYAYTGTPRQRLVASGDDRSLQTQRIHDPAQTQPQRSPRLTARELTLAGTVSHFVFDMYVRSGERLFDRRGRAGDAAGVYTKCQRGRLSCVREKSGRRACQGQGID